MVSHFQPIVSAREGRLVGAEALLRWRLLDFPDQVAARVAAAGSTPEALNLGIAESIAMVGSGQTADILTRLRLRGFKVAIDDLGAGYASLQALLHIPFSYLKIDNAFVTGISASRESLSSVRAIAGMVRGMSLRSMADGVETDAEARTLRELGIDAFQGALYSMPLALEALIGWARTGMWPARQTRNATSPV